MTNELTTSKVQYWANGLMAGLISKEEANQLLSEGKAYFITSSAIGQLLNGEKNG